MDPYEQLAAAQGQDIGQPSTIAGGLLRGIAKLMAAKRARDQIGEYEAAQAQQQQQTADLARNMGLPEGAAAGLRLQDLAKILADQHAAKTKPLTPYETEDLGLRRETNVTRAQAAEADRAFRDRQVQLRQSSLGEQARHNRVMESKSTAPMVTVNAGATESEFAKLLGKKNAERFDAMVTAGQAGRQMQPRIETMLEQNKIALEGPTAEQELVARQAGQRFLGVGDPAILEATEALRGGLSDLVLQKQILQKGPQTESDAKRLENTVSYITTSRGGREQLLNAAKTSSEYDAKFADRVEELINSGENFTAAQRKARAELGDAPDLLSVYEKLASKYQDKVDAPAKAGKFAELPDEDLLGADVTKMTAEEMDQYEAALTARGL